MDEQSQSSSSGYSAIKCDCNGGTRIWYSWTTENPGRRFRGCAKKDRGCGYFRWIDSEVNGWPKVRLNEIRRQLEEKDNVIQQLEERLQRLQKVNEELRGQDTELPESDGEQMASAKPCLEIEFLRTQYEVIKMQNIAMRNNIKKLWQLVNIVVFVFGFVLYLYAMNIGL